MFSWQTTALSFLRKKGNSRRQLGMLPRKNEGNLTVLSSSKTSKSLLRI